MDFVIKCRPIYSVETIHYGVADITFHVLFSIRESLGFLSSMIEKVLYDLLITDLEIPEYKI